MTPSSTTQQIGILGGSFDPVHNGHLGLARQALATFGLDRVVFVPADIPPHKRHQTLTPTHHRLEMLRRAIAGDANLMLSEIEIERGGVSYTLDTVRALQSQWPDAELSLIMGADTFQDIDSWKQFADVLRASHILVASRPGRSLDETVNDVAALMTQLPFSYQPDHSDSTKRVYRCHETGRRIALFPIPPKAISSTQIRDALQRGEAAKKVLPPEVEGYIMAHRLYQTHPHPMS